MNTRDLVAAAAILVAATPSFARSAPGQDTENALREANNPIAARISVPFQSNSYSSAGPLQVQAQLLFSKHWNEAHDVRSR